MPHVGSPKARAGRREAGLLIKPPRGRRYEADPEGLIRAPAMIHAALADALEVYADDIAADLLNRYTAILRGSRRRADGRMLIDAIRQAMDTLVKRNTKSLRMQVFHYRHVERATRNDGQGTESVGWFAFFEDGHRGLDHGSDQWTFLSLYGDTETVGAMDLAERCARELDLPSDERSEFLAYVKEHFAGKYGEGIMVNLDRPLFFKYPRWPEDPDRIFTPEGEEVRSQQFTPARAVLGGLGHPGFEAWNILEQTRRDHFGRGGRIPPKLAGVLRGAVEGAFEKATRL